MANKKETLKIKDLNYNTKKKRWNIIIKRSSNHTNYEISKELIDLTMDYTDFCIKRMQKKKSNELKGVKLAIGGILAGLTIGIVGSTKNQMEPLLLSVGVLFVGMGSSCCYLLKSSEDYTKSFKQLNESSRLFNDISSKEISETNKKEEDSVNVFVYENKFQKTFKAKTGKLLVYK